MIYNQILLGPIEYIQGLPSKNVRGILIEALASWFTISEESLSRTEKIVSSLHHASLLLDDVEDQSPLRRGKPSAYRIFGMPQTINSANYLYVTAVQELLQLNASASHDAFLGLLSSLTLTGRGIKTDYLGRRDAQSPHWTKLRYPLGTQKQCSLGCRIYANDPTQ